MLTMCQGSRVPDLPTTTVAVWQNSVQKIPALSALDLFPTCVEDTETKIRVIAFRLFGVEEHPEIEVIVVSSYGCLGRVLNALCANFK